MTPRHAILPLALLLACGSMSALAAQRGFDVRDLAYYASIVLLCLTANVAALKARREG